MTPKALIGIGMTVMMLFASGCQKQASRQAADMNSEGDELSYWCVIPSASLSTISDMNQMLMYQEMEKRTGVKINFTHTVAGQHDEQFNLMIASRKYPDMIEYYWKGYPGGPDQAIRDNVIIPLNNLLQDYAPNYYKQLLDNENYNLQSRTDEGNYYAFSQLSDPKNVSGFVGMMLRGDWLEDLGLEIPETIDEWETVLRSFKDKKGAPTPFTGDLNIFSPTADHVHTFNTAYGISKGFYMENGKVKYGVLEPAYKEYIKMMRKWVAEGLVDPNYDTNSTQAIDAKMINGEAGACYGGVGAVLGKYMNAVKNSDSRYVLIGAPNPVMHKGEIPKFNSLQKEVDDPSIAITTACKYPEKAAKWADYLYTEAGKYLKNFGVEGITYNIKDGKPVYTDEILNNPDGLSISEAMGKYFRATNPGPGFAQLDDYLEQYYQLDVQKEAFKTWQKNIEEAKKTAMPPFTLTSAENTQKSNILLETDTYTNEMILRFIKGTESMDNYDKFIDNLKNMGIEKVIDIYQSAVDRYYSR